MKLRRSVSSRLSKTVFHTFFVMCVFAVYFKTLSPSVSGGDSGDLLTAICTSGVPHPPGYPLYVLLSKVFLQLTALGASPAWTINFSSTIYGSITALLILLTVTRITKDTWSGLVAAGMFSFSPVVWRYAISSEVFALNNLFASLIFYLFLRYLEQAGKPTESKNNLRLEVLITFFFGLGLSNHHSLLFIGIPVNLYIIWAKRENKSRLWKILAAFLLGLTPYFYLYWAGSHNLVTSWGQTDTLRGFLTHLLRSDYGTLRLTPYQFNADRGGDLGKILYDLAFNELIGFGVVLAGVGLSRQKKQNQSGVQNNPTPLNTIKNLCVLTSFTYFTVFFILNQMPIDMTLKFGVHLRFLQLLLIPTFLLAGMGASRIFKFLKKFTRTQYLIAPLSLALIALQIGLHFRTENQNNNYSASRYAKAYLDNLPTNSILLLSGDGAYYPINYLQSCEHYRTDVSVIPRGLMKSQWMANHVREHFKNITIPNKVSGVGEGAEYENNGFTLMEFLDANYGKFPIYIASYDNTESHDWENVYTSWPTGFTNIILKLNDPQFNRTRLLGASSNILSDINFSDLATFPIESWENIYYRTYKEIYSHLAMILAVSAESEPKSSKFYLDAANHYFNEYFRNNPYPAPLAFKQMALIQHRLKLYQ